MRAHDVGADALCGNVNQRANERQDDSSAWTYVIGSRMFGANILEAGAARVLNFYSGAAHVNESSWT